MKKFLTTILALVYLSTSMGATVHLHYCMGKLFSWSLVDKKSKTCGECGMPKNSKDAHCLSFKDDCCKDTQAHFQLDKDQKTTENAYAFSALTIAALPMTTATLPDSYVTAYITGYPTANAPPDPDNVPVFIRNCTFRI
jgi:hypothetical protein